MSRPKIRDNRLEPQGSLAMTGGLDCVRDTCRAMA
jgi:hypothetical protein